VNAQEALKAGDLDAALTQLQSEVRKRPADARLRIFLFQLLCVRGEWNRALTQLNVAGELDPGALLMVQTYREALRCEVYRAQVFEGKRVPVSLGEPEAWFAPLVQSLEVAAQGRRDEAAALRQAAYEGAPTSAGTLNGTPFEWLADGDTRLGPCLEVIISGRYYWLPFHSLKNLAIEAPTDLRDFVWAPAQLTLSNGAEAAALIPSRYPGSERQADSALRLSRRTDWLEQTEGAYFGLGQRVFITDAGEFALLDARQIEFNAPQDIQQAAG
jgi:type VI secretion system protein ImpE